MVGLVVIDPSIASKNITPLVSIIKHTLPDYNDSDHWPIIKIQLAN